MGRQILILAVAALASLVFSCPLPADETDKAKNIDQLLVSLSSPNQLVRRQTLIEIAKLKSGAEPAVETLCKLLGSNSFSERSDAMEALVAIGRPSVDPVTAQGSLIRFRLRMSKH